MLTLSVGSVQGVKKPLVLRYGKMEHYEGNSGQRCLVHSGGQEAETQIKVLVMVVAIVASKHFKGCFIQPPSSNESRPPNSLFSH